MRAPRVPRYKLFWDPQFEIDRAYFQHAQEPTEFIQRLSEDIRKNGLLNPLFVTKTDDRLVIHPGKCRAKALKLLGLHFAPAIIWTPDGRIHAGCEQISPGDAAGRFRGDVVCEYDHRFFAVKKRSR